MGENPGSRPDSERIPVTAETKKLFLDLTVELLKPKPKKSAGDIFELSDGRGVHAFLDADLQGSADRPDEELAELHLYDAADDSRRHRYVLRRNGAMEHFFDIVAKDRFSETGELENDLLAEGDRMRVAEKADQEAGIATMTESEALEVIEILRALIAERKREG